MKKDFVINLILLLILNGLIKPFYLFGIDRKFQILLGTETYGLYYNIFSFTLILQIVNDFGLQNYTSKFVSQNRTEIEDKFKDFVTLKLLLSAIYIGLTLVLAWIYPYDTALFPIILQLAFNQVLIGGIFFLRSNIIGLGLYKLDSIFSILDRFLLIILGLMVFNISYLREMISMELFVGIQTISLSITILLLAIVCLQQRLQFQLKKINFASVRTIFKSSFPFFLIGLTNLLFTKQDVLLLKKMITNADYEIGIYASSMRLFEAASMIPLVFAGLLLALFSREHENKVSVSSLFKLSNQILIIFTMIMVCCICLYGPFLNKLLYHQENEIWDRILFLCFIAFVPASVNYILGAFLQAMHCENILWKIYLFAVGFNLLLNVFLIPNYKAEGCAIALVLTQVLIFLIQMVIIYKEKLIIWSWSDAIMLISFCTSSIIGAYLISDNITIGPWAEWSLIALFIAALSWIFGFVSPGKLKLLLSK